jgi:hypothetical protein
MELGRDNMGPLGLEQSPEKCLCLDVLSWYVPGQHGKQILETSSKWSWAGLCFCYRKKRWERGEENEEEATAIAKG